MRRVGALAAALLAGLALCGPALAQVHGGGGGSGGTPGGPAGGVLSGTYPNPGFASTTGSGATVLATSPTLVTPALGVATATSVNKLALTAPATSATLTIADGKTLTVNNSLAFSGTDSTTMTLPGSSATLAGLGVAQTWTAVQTYTNSDLKLLGSSTGATTFTSANAGASNFTLTVPATSGTIAELDVADQVVSGGANVTSLSQSTGNITVDCGARPTQYITNGGAFTITAPASDGNCILDMENNGTAGAVTLSGFSPNTMGGATLDTTNGHNFRLFVSRVHAHSSIYAVALQ